MLACQCLASTLRIANALIARTGRNPVTWAHTLSSAACLAAALSCLAAISGGGRFSCGPLGAPNAVEGSSQGILPGQQEVADPEGQQTQDWQAVLQRSKRVAEQGFRSDDGHMIGWQRCNHASNGRMLTRRTLDKLLAGRGPDYAGKHPVACCGMHRTASNART